MSSFSLFTGSKNPNANDSEVVNAATGETAPALPRWERKSFADYAAPKRGQASSMGASARAAANVIPVFPMGAKEIWGCGRCGWRQDRKDGPKPQKQDLGDNPAPLDVEVTKRAAEAIQGRKLEPKAFPEEVSEDADKVPAYTQ